jgi:pimeloyl-ACP methyl ester carboxylesterase
VSPADNYSLEDMAGDTISLLDHLGIARAHLVGMSMGGMIAQAIAAQHAERVASLTSIFSTTGHRRVGQPALSTLWRIARAPSPRTQDEAVRRHADMMRHIGDPASADIEREWRDYARSAWERGGQRANASGIARQIGAIYRSGDRTPQLRKIEVPTLVLHGDVDRMVSPTGGRATADAIAGARLVVVPGLRHQIDEAGSASLTEQIIGHLRSVQEPRGGTPVAATETTWT